MCLSTHLPQAGGHDHAAGHQAHVNLHLPPLVPAVPQRPQRESVYLQILYNCKLPVLERSSPETNRQVSAHPERKCLYPDIWATGGSSL